MGFIRLKKRKTKEGSERIYAYIVENKYRKKGKTPRQKVKKYLGRVYSFEIITKQDPQKSINTSENVSFEEIIASLLEQELEARGFKKNEGEYEQNEIKVNIQKMQVYQQKTGKKVGILLNEGVLTSETLETVLNFKPLSENQRKIGKSLGKALLSAGIKVTSEVFIQLFQKLREKSIDNH